MKIIWFANFVLDSALAAGNVLCITHMNGGPFNYVAVGICGTFAIASLVICIIVED